MNKREKEESDFLINVYSKKIEVFERIFNKFSAFISEIERRTHDDILVLDLKERWGLFLIENSDSNISNFIQKTSNIAKSVNYNYYEFNNGLNLNFSDNIDKVIKGIELSPDLCIGSYMFEIIEYINEINSIPFLKIIGNPQKEIFNKIEITFNKLIKCLESLIEQFKTYKKILGFLGYNKEGLEISQQNTQKIELMNNILDLMKENLKVFNGYDEKKEQIFLKVVRFSLSKFISIKKLKINDLVIEYFREYGLRLFILREKERKDNNNNNCLIY